MKNRSDETAGVSKALGEAIPLKFRGGELYTCILIDARKIAT
jgi:hypothetical protein